MSSSNLGHTNGREIKACGQAINILTCCNREKKILKALSCWHKQPLLDDSHSIAKYLHTTTLLTKGGLNSQNDNVRVSHLPLKQLWQQPMPGTDSLRFSASFISSSVSNNLLPMEPWAPTTHHLFASCRPFNLSHHP